MYRVRITSDADECLRLWGEAFPQEFISDLWEVRDCFNRHYRHEPSFVVAEEGGRVRGLLPLSWNAETGVYNYFPGETWEGKTWLEQNRIFADDRHMLESMLAALPRPFHLRYLRAHAGMDGSQDRIDEIGYHFLPPRFGYDMDRYFGEFSHKTAKRLHKELGAWEGRGLSWRYDEPSDFDLMIEMNLKRYGEMSYFHDRRFLNGFRDLRDLLLERGWLRFVTALVNGEPAAVDMGSVYNGTLTLLAGGTNEAFPGVAKLINTHHMAWACSQRLERADFLCGDFNWKTMFHLTPVPLYLLQGEGHAAPLRATPLVERSLWSTRSFDSRGTLNV